MFRHLTRRTPISKSIVSPMQRENILFVGNSITWHAPKPSLGWYEDCGMAASCREKDYVHLVLQGLDPMNYCIVNASSWERKFWDNTVLETQFSPARAFQADIVVIRIGENVPLDAPHQDEFFMFYDEMVRFFSPKTNATVLVTDLFWRRENLDAAIFECAGQSGYRFVLHWRPGRQAGKQSHRKVLS